jgi:hypothetical protein
MSRRTRSVRFALALAATAVGMLGAVADPASAVTTACNDETTLLNGGEEAWVDAGPGLVFVGADVGGLKGTDEENIVCVASDVAGEKVEVGVDHTPGPVTTSRDGCIADVLAPGCEVQGVTVNVGGDDGVDAVAVEVNDSPIPIVRDGCAVAVGTTCP